MVRVDQDLVAADVALTFANAYYANLKDGRDHIKSYYVAKDTESTSGPIPRIIWNGNEVGDADAMQTLFTNMPDTYFEVQTVNAHVLNPRHFPDLSSDKNVSITVMVGGYLRLEHPKTGPLHEFSETFLLVPNRARLMNRGAAMSKREWLIQHQLFRFVVTHDHIETAGWTSMDVDDMA